MPGRTQAPSYDARFMYLATELSNGELAGNILAIPFPSEGLFETARAVNSARNANNVVVGQMVGRSVDKQSMSWKALAREKWWEINRWIEANGMFFWCKYFAHNYGAWKIRRFYCGDPKCEPFKIDPATGIPEMYINCSINVIDMGEETTVTVSTVQINPPVIDER